MRLFYRYAGHARAQPPVEVLTAIDHNTTEVNRPSRQDETKAAVTVEAAESESTKKEDEVVIETLPAGETLTTSMHDMSAGAKTSLVSNHPVESSSNCLTITAMVASIVHDNKKSIAKTDVASTLSDKENDAVPETTTAAAATEATSVPLVLVAEPVQSKASSPAKGKKPKLIKPKADVDAMECEAVGTKKKKAANPAGPSAAKKPRLSKKDKSALENSSEHAIS